HAEPAGRRTRRHREARRGVWTPVPRHLRRHADPVRAERGVARHAGSRRPRRARGPLSPRCRTKGSTHGMEPAPDPPERAGAGRHRRRVVRLLRPLLLSRPGGARRRRHHDVVRRRVRLQRRARQRLRRRVPSREEPAGGTAPARELRASGGAGGVTIYPAIDLRAGRCVRLTEGDYARETVYGDDPVAMAERFEATGARWLHVVDLDGARAGRPVQLDLVRAIVAALSIPVQAGGGLRAGAAVAAVLDAGAARAVVGTVAVRDPDLCRTICAAHPGRVAVGVDARDGTVRTAGWLEPSGEGPVGMATRL